MNVNINWEKEWEENTTETSRISDTGYWNKRANDYADFIRTSDFEHGRKIKEVLEKSEILKTEHEVLDIAAGPGSLSIPFAESVKKVYSLEPAGEMVKHLLKNALEKGLNNIEIINNTWQEMDIKENHNKFDIVLCSHASWQFPDIGNQLTRINSVSRGYCCLAEGIKQNDDEVFRELKVNRDQLDRFIYLFNILYKKGFTPNVRTIDTVMRRSIASAISMLELNLNKYRTPTEKDMEIINEHVMKHSSSGIYQKNSKMAVMWWKTCATPEDTAKTHC
jgi:ubiquinone/menaquinone biosynthesis C-methylase UbiE